ncbi:MAG: CapA family protein [Mucilaginibacter sp.]|nr:CapA family protein [Mucilaginibacter sp.]
MRILALLILAPIMCALASCRQQPSIAGTRVSHKKPLPVKAAAIVTPKAHDTICIAAMGDIMLGTSYPDSSKLPPDSAKGSFKPVLKYLDKADIIFGNLEGTLLDSGMPDSKKKKLESAYLFRMPTQYGKVLKDAGFNLLSVANNHITDFGNKGCTNTAKTLDNYNIHYAGLQSCPTTVFESNGIKYGFCAFSPNASTLPLLDSQYVKHIIHRLKQRCDILIVSFHGGAEGAGYEHVTFTNELYMGAKRGDVHVFAHIAIDAGADIVLGNGPHVSRALEKYKDRLIAYSLGNFCTYKSVSVAGVCGMAPLLKVYLNKKGEFLSGNIISFRQTHEKGLARDTFNQVVKRIKLLTEKDFPESGLVIDDDGEILSDN